MGEVGEYPRPELQAVDAVLVDPDRADFHEAVAASGLHHLGQQGVDGHGVGGGVGGLEPARPYVVGYRRQQAAFVAELPEHFVEQGRHGGLAVGAGHSHEAEPAAGVSVEAVRRRGDSGPAVLHPDAGDAVGNRRHRFRSRGVLRAGGFIHYRGGSCGDSLGDVGPSVVAAAAHRDEQAARSGLARVVHEGAYLRRGVAVQLQNAAVPDDIFESHFLCPFSERSRSMLYSLSITVLTARTGMPPPWKLFEVGLE